MPPLAKRYCGQEERREEEGEKVKHGKLPKTSLFGHTIFITLITIYINCFRMWALYG
jgi:hypothetical protein